MNTVATSLTFILFLFFSACTRNDDNTKKDTWNLFRWSGTIAGLSKEYDRGRCTWTFQDSTLEIKNSLEDSYMLPKKTTFTTNIEGGKEIIDIVGLGTFTKTISNDTMYLNAPCCDFIDYILVK